jgi:hypothetical protein
MAYASSASTDVAVYVDLPGHHLLAARNLIATTNDESYHGSASELPPATSHVYAEWDFSSVPNPVMFQRFLGTVDYWFGYSDDFSAGSYDPARECFVVVVDDQANGTNAVGAGDREAPKNPRTRLLQGSGPSAPPAHRRGAPTSTRSWPSHSPSSTASCTSAPLRASCSDACPSPKGASSFETFTQACAATTRRRAPSWATHSAKASIGPPR